MRASVKYLLYLLLANSSALFVYFRWPSPQSDWLLWATFFFALAAPLNQPFMRMLSIVLASLLVASGVFLAGLLGVHPFFIAIYLSAITFVCVWWAIQRPSDAYLAVAANFLILIAANSTPPLSENIDRAVYILCGGAIAAFFQLMFAPCYARQQLSFWTIKTIEDLSLVSQELFACFLRPEYADNVYLFEKRLHLCKMRFIRSMASLRDSIGAPALAAEHLNQRVRRLDLIFDVLMDCAQMRRRVSDHTVFALCTGELKGVSVEMQNVFRQMIGVAKKRQEVVDTQGLAERIRLFEDNFQSVLRIVAREPLAFLLFIASLKNLSEETGLYE